MLLISVYTGATSPGRRIAAHPVVGRTAQFTDARTCLVILCTARTAHTAGRHIGEHIRTDIGEVKLSGAVDWSGSP